MECSLSNESAVRLSVFLPVVGGMCILGLRLVVGGMRILGVRLIVL